MAWLSRSIACASLSFAMSLLVALTSSPTHPAQSSSLVVCEFWMGPM